MPLLETIDDLSRLHAESQHLLKWRQPAEHGQSVSNLPGHADILICGGTGCVANNSRNVLNALKAEIEKQGLSNTTRLVFTGCHGFCAKGPLVVIHPRDIFYSQVKPEDAQAIITETVLENRVIERLTYRDPISKRKLPIQHDIPFYSKQMRVSLRNCGLIDPERIDEYIATDGYRALAKALTEMEPDDVIEEVKNSGLRGRGGAGFQTGIKWEFCRRSFKTPKYVICNADEGDPGAFMDRSILEGDPHSLIEGMILAGYAIGSNQGYIYCRAEYPLAIERLETALNQAREYGLLGENILGTGFSFDLEVYEGAGAFVCGEETALMASIEGRRGEPRPRPPFPAVSGLWNKPSNVNNVKSYALTPQIILKGADWFAGIGAPKSPGTAIFALTGQINNIGLIEVPMGITLREIIYEIGGGIPKKKRFKAVQTGGPLGGCLPESALDTPVDFDSLVEAGATMGSGGMIVVDQDTCMVEFAKYFLTFASAESCGKCIPCRMGGQRMLEILTRISLGRGTLADLDEIEYISRNMREASLCALGQLTPGPIMAGLRFFRAEYESHIVDKFCPAGVCQDMFRYEISTLNCVGCGLCVKPCPQNSITGSKKEPHEIDQITCIRCGVCYQVCNLDAIDIKPAKQAAVIPVLSASEGSESE